MAAPIAAAFGVIGRKFRFDERFVGRWEDGDLSLQILAKDMILVHDRRFYFEFGKMSSAQGGNTGIRTKVTDDADLALVKEKWGRYVRLSSKTRKAGSAFVVSVQRRQLESMK